MYKKLVVFCVLFFQVNLFSQTLFKHVEDVSGFKDLRDNNGVAVADYDGDLDLDVFVVTVWKDEQGNTSTESKLYRNNGNGTFTDVTKNSGLEDLLPTEEVDATYESFLGLKGFKNGAFWGDYDNDGDPDIFFTHLSQVQLFQNQGDGTFMEVTDAAGIQGTNNCENMGAAWFDYNNDSYLDIYIVDWKRCSSNTLYKNNGDGTFTDVTASTNIQTTEGSTGYNPFPFDFNNDGFMDIYVTNDFREPNQLFINNNGQTFTENATQFNLDNEFNDMGITIGDYNKDQIFDFYITTIANNVLLEGKANNTYENKAVGFDLKETGWSWGTKFADFDLDGDEDLVIVNGFQSSSQKEFDNYYFENTFSNGVANFTRANNQDIEELTISVEALDFDYDADGDLDLIITNSETSSFFYDNQTVLNGDSSLFRWFQLSLQGTISNRDGIGTKVTIITDRDTFIRYYNGIGFLGQSLKPIHFGLADASTIQTLKIEWPSGTVDTYSNLDLNTFGKAIEGTSYEKLNIQPAVKILGCTDPNSCNYNPNATISDNSCEYASIKEEINGPVTSSFFATETYNINLDPNHFINWEVDGGHILNGEGTASITVRWEFKTDAKVKAVITTENCKSDEISLDVNLSLTELPSNISIARIWNEALLGAIRNDFARPTVHARNLFHTSIALYDIWAIYKDTASPYLIGNTVNNFTSNLESFTPEESIDESIKKAMSYAAYRLLTHRFQNSPGKIESQAKFDIIMSELGYDTSFTDINYENGNAAAFGNYVASVIINYGLQDGSRETTDYDNGYYAPVNSPMAPIIDGNPKLSNPNRWQSLSLDTFIDQSGNLIEGDIIDFLSPEWGNVWGFALKDEDKTTYTRSNNTYNVYHDPLNPPYLDVSNPSNSNEYKEGFSQVAIWGSHLDASDGVAIDISPKSIGNINSSTFPTDFKDYNSFYKFTEGGDIGTGHALNPHTNQPYETQFVPRGDYTRVLAEFWADGPDSETPPGHWFTILNYVNDNPLLEKKMEGKGEVLSDLEWDVKSYFLLGGAVHDAAISAWSVKGWYDYIRPISAIRYMADLGQSSNENLPNYHPNGIPLMDGYIELVTANDELAFRNPQNIDKIKLKTWKGHSEILNTDTDVAGVDWILAEDWWPYQRPSFVTPPFAGYVSGHSTFSRAAAEVLTLLTGDEFFPGGLGEFIAKKNEFLVFEEGPSKDIVLQWATYRDASDQCSLSRIWGGIHPPADDIPGRIIGEKVGLDAFNFGLPYFTKESLSTLNLDVQKKIVYPNPVENENVIYITNTTNLDSFFLIDITGKQIQVIKTFNSISNRTEIQLQNLATGVYILTNKNGWQEKLIIK